MPSPTAALKQSRSGPTAGVAVVGNRSPAGLACADELAKLGFAVTVFESLASSGGLLVYGIPSFKLDKSVVARRVGVLRRRGVQFFNGMRLGVEMSLSDLQHAFDAVFLGIGAQKPKPLDVPGAALKGTFNRPFRSWCKPISSFPAARRQFPWPENASSCSAGAIRRWIACVRPCVVVRAKRRVFTGATGLYARQQGIYQCPRGGRAL